MRAFGLDIEYELRWFVLGGMEDRRIKNAWNFNPKWWEEWKLSQYQK